MEVVKVYRGSISYNALVVSREEFENMNHTKLINQLISREVRLLCIGRKNHYFKSNSEIKRVVSSLKQDMIQERREKFRALQKKKLSNRSEVFKYGK